jgi:hypothetical protein
MSLQNELSMEKSLELSPEMDLLTKTCIKASLMAYKIDEHCNINYKEVEESQYCEVKKCFRNTEYIIGKVNGVVENTKSIIIAFKGTEGFQDVLTDLKFSLRRLKYDNDFSCDAKIHKGFGQSYNDVVYKIRDQVKNLKETEDLDNIIVTGHSLGGALAFLCSADMLHSGLYESHKIKCVTFGSPRVGNSHFAEEFISMIPDTHRFVQGHDIIPSIPLYQMDFQHCGNLYHVGSTHIYDLSGDQQSVSPTSSVSSSGTSEQAIQSRPFLKDEIISQSRKILSEEAKLKKSYKKANIIEKRKIKKEVASRIQSIRASKEDSVNCPEVINSISTYDCGIGGAIGDSINYFVNRMSEHYLETKYCCAIQQKKINTILTGDVCFFAREYAK